jgi:aspartyl-tRNA(Asn)/glutamyl-tRNA(Gln) amidotransferase subunit C
VKITRDEAKKIADLAHLAFDDAALERMAAEMTKILTYIDQLAEVDVGPNVGQASACPTPLREDIVSSPRVDPSTNAPAWDSGHFVVPKVIGE